MGGVKVVLVGGGHAGGTIALAAKRLRESGIIVVEDEFRTLTIEERFGKIATIKEFSHGPAQMRHGPEKHKPKHHTKAVIKPMKAKQKGWR